MKHIIKKQIIDLTLDKSVDAFSIQQKISDQYHAKIVPLLQQAFDAASPGDEVITIDRLEVNVGTINFKELEKGEWIEKIAKDLSEQLLTLQYELKSPLKTTIHPRRLNDAHQWLFYMRYGYLSWNVLEINEDWYKNILAAFASDSTAINQLRELINNYPNAVKRIVSQHSETFLRALVETLTAVNQADLPKMINEVAKIRSTPEKNKKHPALKQMNVREQSWMQVLKIVAGEPTQLTSSKIIGRLLGGHFFMSRPHTKKMQQFISRNKVELHDMKTIVDTQKNIVKEPIQEKENTAIHFKTELNEDEIYVMNAGVVLLHPFLPRFFNNLQLIKDEFFADAFCQQKALHLLRYLATGNVKLQEYELVIPKVLCSHPLEDPVDYFIELNDEELTEGESLLESAIGQWTILKGTSPDGLREGFLQRKGKLFTNNGNLVLLIEQSAIDMLLDHLPWNLNIIKLPWMKELLKVEWR